MAVVFVRDDDEIVTESEVLDLAVNHSVREIAAVLEVDFHRVHRFLLKVGASPRRTGWERAREQDR